MQDDDGSLEVLKEEICSALKAKPSGLTRDQLYTATSAESLQPLVKVLHRLREAGEVINLTGTPSGPYMHHTFIESAPERKAVVPPATPEPKPKVSKAPPAPPKAAQMGNLRQDSARAHLAFAAYRLHTERPGLYASYDVIMSRAAPKMQNMKHRAAVFAQLVDLGYLERADGDNSLRWNANRFKYPFAKFDMLPDGSGPATPIQPAIKVVDVGGQAAMVSEVTAAGIQPVVEDEKQPCPNTCHLLRMSKLEARVNTLTDSMCSILNEMRLLMSEIQELKTAEQPV